MRNRSDKQRLPRDNKKIESGIIHFDQDQPGYDPELLYVECARCGAPVLWEPGRATKLLTTAGVDPIELDSSCILMTDACPACGGKDEYSVRIFRISDHPQAGFPPTFGHA